jgi:hypothetical protein
VRRNILSSRASNLASQLHKISEVIVVDHLECGCYKAYYGTKDDHDDAAVARHFTNMEAFCMYINNKFGVATKGFLTRVDGTLEPGMGLPKKVEKKNSAPSEPTD